MLKSVMGRWRVGEKLRTLPGPSLMLGVCILSVHEALVVSGILYDSETMIWREKEKSRIRDVQKFSRY